MFYLIYGLRLTFSMVIVSEFFNEFCFENNLYLTRSIFNLVSNFS